MTTRVRAIVVGVLWFAVSWTALGFAMLFVTPTHGHMRLNLYNDPALLDRAYDGYTYQPLRDPIFITGVLTLTVIPFGMAGYKSSKVDPGGALVLGTLLLVAFLRVHGPPLLSYRGAVVREIFVVELSLAATSCWAGARLGGSLPPSLVDIISLIGRLVFGRARSCLRFASRFVLPRLFDSFLASLLPCVPASVLL